MKEIPQISSEERKKIKEIVRFHYGFTPRDENIDNINKGLKNNYQVLHNQRIIKELVASEASKNLLKYKKKLGIKFDEIWLEKDIFKYLTWASMCFRAGIPIGTICLCRIAIEAGLRERIVEEMAQREIKQHEGLSQKILENIKKLEGTPFVGRQKEKGLIGLAEKFGIIAEKEMERIFKRFEFKQETGRKILDKFIHGNLIWKTNFIKEKIRNHEVIGARDKLEEYKIISDTETDKIAIEILKTAYEIAEILYYKNI